jgi:hypothetical protein
VSGRVQQGVQQQQQEEAGEEAPRTQGTLMRAQIVKRRRGQGQGREVAAGVGEGALLVVLAQQEHHGERPGTQRVQGGPRTIRGRGAERSTMTSRRRSMRAGVVCLTSRAHCWGEHKLWWARWASELEFTSAQPTALTTHP